MKAYWGVEAILDLNTGWRWVVSFTSLPLYPRVPLDKRMGGPQRRCGRCGEEKNLGLPGIEPGTMWKTFSSKILAGHEMQYVHLNTVYTHALHMCHMGGSCVHTTASRGNIGCPFSHALEELHTLRSGCSCFYTYMRDEVHKWWLLSFQSSGAWQCSLVARHQCFGGTSCLHLQNGRKRKQEIPLKGL
jgi:hypothetical protein